MPAERLGHPPPIVQSMILADQVHIDPSTGKKYILGVHNGILSAAFPAKHGFHMYFAITGGHGRVMLRIRIVDVDDAIGSITESVFPFEMPDPTRVYDSTFHTVAVFPTPGDYRVQLYSGDDLLRELRLRVALRQPNAPPAEAS
jgi:hypothetical protein